MKDELVDRFIRKQFGNENTEVLTANSGILKTIFLPRENSCTASTC